MTQSMHSWLIVHPIWQSVFTNAVVGIALLLITVYWKVIVAFCKIPPQQLGIWLRKARVTTLQNKLYMLRRANNDYRYATALFIKRFVYLLLLLAFILIPISQSVILSQFRLTDHPFAPSFVLVLRDLVRHNSIARATFIVIPYYAFTFMALRLLKLAREYAFFDEIEDSLLININQLRSSLGEAPLPQINSDRPIRPFSSRLSPIKLKENMMVIHPRYGLGKVLVMSDLNDLDIVTVDFENYGVRKFASKYAQLRPA